MKRMRLPLRLMALALLVAGLPGCWGINDDGDCPDASPPPPAPSPVATTLAQTSSSLTATVVGSSSGIGLTFDSATLYNGSAACPEFDAQATLNGLPMSVGSEGGVADLVNCPDECCTTYAYTCNRLSFSIATAPLASSNGLNFVISDQSGLREIKLSPLTATVLLQGSNVVSPGNDAAFTVSPASFSVVQVLLQSPDGLRFDDVTRSVEAQTGSFSVAIPSLAAASEPDGLSPLATCIQSRCPEIISGSVLPQTSGTFSKCDFGSCGSQLTTSFSIPIVLDTEPELDAGSSDADAPDAGD